MNPYYDPRHASHSKMGTIAISMLGPFFASLSYNFAKTPSVPLCPFPRTSRSIFDTATPVEQKSHRV